MRVRGVDDTLAVTPRGFGYFTDKSVSAGPDVVRVAPARLVQIFRAPEVNFTNVLRAAFMYVSCARSFLCLHFRFVLYWRKPTGAKAVRRTVMKLSPGVVHF